MNIPLSVLLENTKIRMTDSVNKVIQESNLPAYLIEGILSDVRKQKNIELASDYATMQKDKEQDDKKEGEE